MDDNMVDTIKKKGIREAAGDNAVGAEVYEAIDERVKELVEDAVERAEANGRSTIKAKDV